MQGTQTLQIVQRIAHEVLVGDESVGTEVQPADAIEFGTLGADTALTSNVFAVDNDQFDLDRPTEGFASIPEAVEDIRQGKMVLVVDDEDRENEGDLTMAAQLATSEAMAFMLILRGLGVPWMKLMTNNPAKYIGRKGYYGLTVSGRIPLLTLITKDKRKYLETKRVKMGYVYALEFNDQLSSNSGACLERPVIQLILLEEKPGK